MKKKISLIMSLFINSISKYQFKRHILIINKFFNLTFSSSMDGIISQPYIILSRKMQLIIQITFIYTLNKSWFKKFNTTTKLNNTENNTIHCLARPICFNIHYTDVYWNVGVKAAQRALQLMFFSWVHYFLIY